MNKVIIISGPTACGKTQASIELASMIQGQLNRPVTIVNFDSLLFYKELNIGTAKPTSAEMHTIPHRLINIASIANPLNAAEYVRLAETEMAQLHLQNHIVLLVGGSGFYLRALIKGMYPGHTPPKEITEKVNTLFQTEGIAPFLKILQQHDPQSYKDLHPNDHYRIIRAVEYFWTTGESISKQKANIRDPYDLSHPLWKIFHCYLDLPKEQHLHIIQERTQKMITNGLVDEVTALLKQFSGTERPLQSIGYKETLDFLKGKFASQDEYLQRIVISTRQLAKAQRTWFQKIAGKEHFNPLTQMSSLKQQVLNHCQ